MDENQLLYEKILNYLKQEIQNQNLKPGDRLPTELELAEQFKVSRITSKRALEELKSQGLIFRKRGSGSYVSSSSKKEEDTALDTMDYSRIVPFILPFDVSNGGIMNAVIGASRVMEDNGYLLSVHCCNNNLTEEKRLLQQLYQKKAAGMIHYPISDSRNLEIMNFLCLNQYPIVTIDKYYESIPVSYVVSDNEKGMYEAVSHLISLKHKNIAFVSDRRIEEATSIRNRYFGYCKALVDHQIPIQEQFVKSGIVEQETEFEETIRETLKELHNNKVTAICAINDYIASSFIKEAVGLKIAVPEDISVIGFDNLEFGRYLSVPLTSVQQNFYKIGKTAAELLLESIKSGEHRCFKSIVPTKLIERKSCCKNRKEKVG